jgi:hypothetical protein
MRDTTQNGDSTDLGTNDRFPLEASPSTDWRAACWLNHTDTPDEPCLHPPDTLEAILDPTRTLRNRTKHARRTTT